jgi:poly-gamma-glutamate synthesis protein (capsule biosynthesis protein)
MVLAHTLKKNGCDIPFAKLGGIFNNTDILIGNLEGVLSSRGINESLRFVGVPGMAHAIRKAGFEIITLANNHVYDHGPEMLEETIEHCRSAGLKICGIKGDGDYYCEPVVVEKRGITVGVLAYNWIGLEDNEGIDSRIANISDGVVNYTWNRDKERDIQSRKDIKSRNIQVINDISRLKKEVDIVIVLPHWGYEWTIYPPYGVVLEAKTFINAGADLILGSHPHVAQGIEVYNDKVIAYSMGNFLFDPHPSKYFLGMVFECECTKDKIINNKYYATKCDDQYRIEIANINEQNSFTQKIKESTEAVLSSNAEQMLDDDLIYKQYEDSYKIRKIQNVKFLFIASLMNPHLVKQILKKVINLFVLLVMRIQGKKIRW